MDLSAASGVNKAVRSVASIPVKATLRATTLPPRHIPLAGAAPCEACHRPSTNLAVAVRMNHDVV